ncbi:MAG: HDIG domain-containing protein [Candidatus Bathyarchaeia archaeon]
MSDLDPLTRESLIAKIKKQGFSDLRIEHSCEVADIALKLSDLMAGEGLNVERGVVEKGSILHDIGYLLTSGKPLTIPGWEGSGIIVPSDDINHPMLGALIVEKWGFSDRISDCVLRHNIGCFTVAECKLLGVDPVPRKDCMPITIEEKIVHYSDHLMLLKRLRYDPLKDPEASAKACLPWLKHYFKERTGIVINMDHPTVQRELEIHNAFKKYLERLDVDFQGVT